MSVYPDDWQVKFQKAGAWGAYFDATADVLDLRAYYGIKSTRHQDRTAQIGAMTFRLNNSATNSQGIREYYSPNSAGGLSLVRGVQVFFYISYDNEHKYKFHGWIQSIRTDAGIYGPRSVTITAWDWMGVAANAEVDLLDVATNKTIDEAVPLVIAGLDGEIPEPKDTEYNTGQSTFPSVFDASSGKVLGEINKLVLSEFGYAYVKGSETIPGGVFTIDGRYTRNSLKDLTKFPVGTDSAKTLQTESGDDLLAENGDYLAIDEEQSVSWTGQDIRGMDVGTSRNQIYDARVSVYPRETDSTNVVLYQLQDVPLITPDQTITIRGSYRDPDQKASRVAATDQVDPDDSTDYTFNSAEDGGGTDLTANLGISYSFGANEFEYEITNNGSTSGYLTKLEVRGKGIYFYNPVTASYNGLYNRTYYGAVNYLRINLAYQDDIDFAQGLCDFIFSKEQHGRLTVERLDFSPNRSSEHMLAFLSLEPGARISISEEMTQINDEYFINGVGFTLRQGDIIDATWYLKEASDEDWWELGVSELGVDTVLAF
jgi:hypothetical protein